MELGERSCARRRRHSAGHGNRITDGGHLFSREEEREVRAFGFRGASEELGHLAAYSRLEFHLQIEMQIAEHFISKASVIPASCLLCPPRGYVDGYVRGCVPLLGTTSRTERVRGRPVICIQQVAPAGGRAWPLSSLTSLPSVYTDTTVFRIT